MVINRQGTMGALLKAQTSPLWGMGISPPHALQTLGVDVEPILPELTVRQGKAVMNMDQIGHGTPPRGMATSPYLNLPTDSTKTDSVHGKKIGEHAVLHAFFRIIPSSLYVD